MDVLPFLLLVLCIHRFGRVVDYVLVFLVLDRVCSIFILYSNSKDSVYLFWILEQSENGKSEQVNTFIITSHIKGKCVNSIKLAILGEEFNRVNGEVQNYQLHIHRVGNFIDWNCILIDDGCFQNGTIGSNY